MVMRMRLPLPGHDTHLHELLVDIGLVKVEVHRVPGGHHVIVVHHLNKENITLNK